MKRIFLFLCMCFTVFVLALPIYAHKGNTDSNGGHYDRESGSYHYHHGYPAHSHTNGVCPYEKSNVKYNPNVNGGISGNQQSSSSTKKKNEDEFDNSSLVAAVSVITVGVGIIFIVWKIKH